MAPSQSGEASAAGQGKQPMSLPHNAGLCLKPQHYQEILDNQPAVGWFEVHAENYLGAGGAPLYYLEKIRQAYPLSIHGVGLSIGAGDGLDDHHLERVAQLVERFEPESFSEHLAWSTHDNRFFSDLLPLPYNRQIEDLVCNHIDQIQSRLGRPMLLENPSNYLVLDESVQAESEFIGNVIRRTGCGLLLDVNNVYVSSENCDYSAHDYLASLPLQAIGEIHLAGHALDDSIADDPLLIDAHDRTVCDAVWALYATLIQQIGAHPTLIEWDSNIPVWHVLMAEMEKADQLLNQIAGSVRNAAQH